MELFFPAPRVFYDSLRKSWFKRMTAEVTTFRDALEVCLYEMPKHPSTQWHERFDRFVADQAAAGRKLSPESRDDIRLYLDDWLDSLKPTMQLASAVNEKGGDTWPALSEEDRERTRAQYGLPGWYAKSLEWGDEEWEKVFESLGRESRDRMLEVCQQLSVLGGMAKDADKLADDGLDELTNQKQRVQAAYDAYLLSLVEIQRQWLEYINKHWFIGLQVQKLIARLEANLPPRLFDLTSTHLKTLATVSNDVNKALGKVVSRVDTAYNVAWWTDRVITTIEVATAVGAIGVASYAVFKVAAEKGIAKAVAVRMAINYGVKQLAVQATAYVAAGYALPPLLAASGLNQDFVFTGLMVVQGLGMLHAVRSAQVARRPLKPGAAKKPDVDLPDEVVRSENPSALDDLAAWRADMKLGAPGTKVNGKEYVLSRLDVDGHSPVYGINWDMGHIRPPGVLGQFLKHAEGDALSQAANAGILRGGKATLYVDKMPCDWCWKSFANFSKYHGIEELTVVTPLGIFGRYNSSVGRFVKEN